jgi:hypothetical protein
MHELAHAVRLYVRADEQWVFKEQDAYYDISDYERVETSNVKIDLGFACEYRSMGGPFQLSMSVSVYYRPTNLPPLPL